jgi:MFS family permease
MTSRPARILPTIMFSQFAGTSLWFAGNAVLPDLQQQCGLPPEAVGDITSAVQLGFIAGTLVFAITSLSDRFSPRKIFLCCAVLGRSATERRCCCTRIWRACWACGLRQASS